MREPLVAVLPRWKVKRWDGGSDTDGVIMWPVKPLSEAVTTVYDHDAMIMPLILDAKDVPALSGAALRVAKVAHEARVEVLIYDVDPPKGVDGSVFKEAIRAAVEDLAFDEDLGYWETMRGWRLVVWLERPVTVAEYPSVWQGWYDWLIEKGVTCDKGSGDIMHVFRPPNVKRMDDRYQGDLRGSWEAPGRPLALRFGEASREVGAGGLQAVAAVELGAGERNKGMVRVAGSLKRVGLSDRAMVAALLAIDLDICKPPLQETDPGEIERIVVDKAAKWERGDLGAVVGGRPGGNVDLSLGSQSELGDIVLGAIEEGAEGVSTVYTDGELLRWSPSLGYWVAVEPDEVSRMVMELDGARVSSGKRRTRLKVDSGTVVGVWKLIAAKRGRREWRKEREPGVLVEGGVRWTIAGRESAAAKWRDTWMIAGSGADESCVEWMKFLKWMTCGDVAMEMVLQEFAGAVLFGIACRYEKALLLYGRRGANGKSVFLKVLRALLPPEVVCSVDPGKFGEDYWKARLKGKVLNVVTEMGSGKASAEMEENFKAIVVGDTVGAREPGFPAFDMTPVAAHAGATNKLPHVSDFTEAWWRRWILLPCNAVLSEGQQVAGYEDVLLGEAAGIVRWAVEGGRRLVRQGGYSNCDAANVSVAAWRMSADQVAEFLNDVARGVVGDLQSLYDRYLLWAANSGAGRLKRSNFKERLDLLLGGQRRVEGDDGSRCRRYVVPSEGLGEIIDL